MPTRAAPRHAIPPPPHATELPVPLPAPNGAAAAAGLLRALCAQYAYTSRPSVQDMETALLTKGHLLFGWVANMQSFCLGSSPKFPGILLLSLVISE